MSALSDQIAEFIAVFKFCVATQIAKEQSPTFQDWNILLDIDRRTRRNTTKLAVKTKGNIGFMLGSLRVKIRSYKVTPI